MGKICLSDCAHKGAEDPKKDSDECQYLCHFDLKNIEVDTPPFPYIKVVTCQMILLSNLFLFIYLL